MQEINKQGWRSRKKASKLMVLKKHRQELKNKDRELDRRRLYWVDVGWLPGAHQAALSLPLFNKTGRENTMKKLVGQDKDKEITPQLLSQAKQTRLREINIIYCQSKSE